MITAVSGAAGYLGSAVARTLGETGRESRLDLGRLERLAPGTLDCRAVVHCAGSLRGQPATRIWADNVTATAALLAAVRADTVIVFSSSRAAADPAQDLYARSKSAAEMLTSAHPGPAWLIRLTVLAGPSPRGTGGSFLTRMAGAALRTSTITIPPHDRFVDLLDVREAAAVMSALTELPVAWPGPVAATTGPLALGALAELTAAAVRDLTGRRVRIAQTLLSAGRRQPPACPTGWNELRSLVRIPPVPVESTVHDTVAALATPTEHADDRR
ncbi:NAD-dependent epimerase/dehydratase family protein [Streptomyces sp. NPDC019443]|uniref:NAD-dependent epimerase/dehydratase family protein n=1 Tax=Streptomyces sp. NPDC019443 TaxID=3365061 RepID=UPI0037A81E9A